MPLYSKNVWGSYGSNLDQQRSDLFRVAINLPPNQGTPTWNSAVEFAVSKFPFPERKKTTIPVKFLQQTNYTLGADADSGPIDMTIRYAFNQQTATVLETWWWQVAHPATGGVALTSSIKTSGYFYWLNPSVAPITPSLDIAASTATSSPYTLGGVYVLEGVMLVGLKPSDADMEQNNGLVNFAVSLSIDRYYPTDPANLSTTNGQAASAAAGLVTNFNGAGTNF